MTSLLSRWRRWRRRRTAAVLTERAVASQLRPRTGQVQHLGSHPTHR